MSEPQSEAAIAAAANAERASKGQLVLDMASAIGADNFRQMVAGYIEAAYFTDTGPDDEQPDSETPMSGLATLHCLEAVAEFLSGAGPDASLALAAMGYDATQLGRDIWYTRNGHGVGFWSREQLDSDEPGVVTLGDRLSDVADKMGAINLYAGDDGLIYFGG